MANQVVDVVTNHGRIAIELDSEHAPGTVQNFLEYVDAGHYAGTIFHRVIDGFMLQGGGYDAAYEKKPVRAPIKNEADNGLKNMTGTVAMARTNEPDSATAQFFINLSDNEFLNHRGTAPRDWGYAVFGRVVEGMEVADVIRKQKTGAKGSFAKDAPLTEVVIQSISRR